MILLSSLLSSPFSLHSSPFQVQAGGVTSSGGGHQTLPRSCPVPVLSQPYGALHKPDVNEPGPQYAGTRPGDADLQRPADGQEGRPEDEEERAADTAEIRKVSGGRGKLGGTKLKGWIRKVSEGRGRSGGIRLKGWIRKVSEGRSGGTRLKGWIRKVSEGRGRSGGIRLKGCRSEKSVRRGGGQEIQDWKVRSERSVTGRQRLGDTRLKGWVGKVSRYMVERSVCVWWKGSVRKVHWFRGCMVGRSVQKGQLGEDGKVGHHFNIMTIFKAMGIPIIKIRQSHNHRIFITGIPILMRWCIYVGKSGKSFWLLFSGWHFQMHFLEWKCINFD